MLPWGWCAPPAPSSLLILSALGSTLLLSTLPDSCVVSSSSRSSRGLLNRLCFSLLICSFCPSHHHPMASPSPLLPPHCPSPPPTPASPLACPHCRKAGLILSQLGDLSSWCNGLLQEPKISLQRSSLKYLACRYSEIKPYGLDWSELSRDLKKTCEEQTLSVLYNDYGDKDY